MSAYEFTATRDIETTQAFISALPNSENVSMVVVYEGEDASADSLTPHVCYLAVVPFRTFLTCCMQISCPRFDSAMGSIQSGAWYDKYTTPIIARFNEEILGFNLTVDDIVGMQQLCGYDTIIRNKTNFCNIFTPEEWLSFEYANDLMYFYSIG